MQTEQDDGSRALAAKGTLLLTVKVETEDQAREILRWMYATQKPMGSKLVEISWDKVAVPKIQADALEVMRQSILA